MADSFLERWNLDERSLPPEEEALAPANPEEELRQGSRAQALRNDPAYQEALAQMRAGVLQTFSETPLRDREGLLYCRLMLKVLDDFDNVLRDRVDTGKMAALVKEGVEAFKGTLE